jgi:periplasmic divalent cation tolerance protein
VFDRHPLLHEGPSSRLTHLLETGRRKQAAGNMLLGTKRPSIVYNPFGTQKPTQMTDKVIVLTTCATREDAMRIARALVERRLAACVNVVPNVVSVYRWQGAIEESAEWLLVIKTATGLVENLKLELPKIHPYELPELVAVNVVDGAESYLNWLTAELDTGDDVA